MFNAKRKTQHEGKTLMLTYDLQKSAKMPLYETLYRNIRNDILSGVLHAGERLPSKRALAEHLNVSKVTVENAYAQLIAEGFVRTVPKSGCFVEKVERIERKLSASMPAANIPAPKTWLADYTRSSTTPECFPFSTWAKLMRRVILDSSTALLDETPFNGAPELRNAIAGYLYRFRALHVSPEQIIIGAGSEYLYQLLIQLIGREKRWAVEDPGYRKVSRILHANGVALAAVPLDSDGICIDALQSACADVVHISPTHHFPTGIVTPMRRRQQLLQWACEEKERIILEDDYDSEFCFGVRPIPTLQSLDGAQRVVYINTFSKTMAPSLRISYMVLPQPLMDRYRAELSFYACTVPVFEQLTLAHFINEGYFEKHLGRAGKYYKGIREELLHALSESSAASRLRISAGDSGLHFLLHLKTEQTEGSILQALAEEGIAVNFLSRYYEDSAAHANERALVINYAGVGRDNVCAIVAALEKIL